MTGMFQRVMAVLVLTSLVWSGAAAETPAAGQPASPQAGAREPSPAGVVVVLAGGGAKGFAHLAVLRQLEKDRVPIARIVGTSMGAVIGGLYASGLSTTDIEKVIGELDPARVALDQLDRLDLPPRTRAYQQQYPIGLEFGIHDGALSFARGASDGQRFLALLQKLMAHVPGTVDFNTLPIPFRAVATRYRDGEMVVFDHGSLPLAIRASMAAPGVFAPADIEGETYVDGGLVANLPVEAALQEGAGTIVASYLGQDASVAPRADNALVVANQMIDILIRQNERRNLRLLRPQDILVQTELAEVGFVDFNQAAQIVQRGEQALAKVAEPWQRMVRQYARQTPTEPRRTASDQREIVVDAVRVAGQQRVPEGYVQSVMAPLTGRSFDVQQTGELVDRLYTSGYFEQVSYSLEQVRDERYALVVGVTEKPYGDHLFRTSFGFSTESGGMDQFSIGLGYRRPWLTPGGLELLLDARIGTLTEFGGRLYQPLGLNWGVEAGLGYRRNTIPVYPPQVLSNYPADQRLAYFHDRRREAGVTLNYEFDRKSVMKFGVVRANQGYAVDVARQLEDSQGQAFDFQDVDYRYTAAKWQWEVDRLDSLNFPTRGYFASLDHEAGISGARYSRTRASLRSAYSWRAHVFNFGANLGVDELPRDCSGNCGTPTSLYMGGFQFMGAYKMGQLTGDRLAHVYATYMYRLSHGGLLGQKSYVGLVAERGDAWYADERFRPKDSLSLFIAVDSKIGDIYLGGARGSGGASNLFLQLGRRFSF